MTIRPGEPWGSAVELPAGAVTVGDDAEIARMLRASAGGTGPPIVVRGGDLARTLGIGATDSATVNEFPIDLFEVRLELDGTAVGDALVGCAHLVARRPWWRGGWSRGPILAVMNAEFIGAWDVAPRGHPNDGRVDAFEVSAAMSIRHRLAARRRLRSATHLPHPEISTRSVRTATFAYPEALAVRIDGHPVGSASTISVTVVPDAGIVHA